MKRGRRGQLKTPGPAAPGHRVRNADHGRISSSNPPFTAGPCVRRTRPRATATRDGLLPTVRVRNRAWFRVLRAGCDHRAVGGDGHAGRFIHRPPVSDRTVRRVDQLHLRPGEIGDKEVFGMVPADNDQPGRGSTHRQGANDSSGPRVDDGNAATTLIGHIRRRPRGVECDVQGPVPDSDILEKSSAVQIHDGDDVVPAGRDVGMPLIRRDPQREWIVPDRNGHRGRPGGEWPSRLGPVREQDPHQPSSSLVGRPPDSVGRQ